MAEDKNSLEYPSSHLQYSRPRDALAMSNTFATICNSFLGNTQARIPTGVIHMRKRMHLQLELIAGYSVGRMTVAYFCLGALDLLGEIPQLSPELRQECLDWIYAQQIHSTDEGDGGEQDKTGSRLGHETLRRISDADIQP
ncbi:hypothetical protein HDU87_006084 [Geranomyces variabilis]|uniref:Prenyltransferase alpha-alpha toroid domain-containing protein n=1 Tax=Geranomyces variabilis TaxID=109894 RepID=A0AAD5TG31_9FUNG|nr:hypothetical protein HDU87_006084 [Geranomyces variabilis]